MTNGKRRSVGFAVLWLASLVVLALALQHDVPRVPMTPAWAIAALEAQEAPPITDDPESWPESWKDADQRVKSCTNTALGKKGGGEHGKGGTLANPTNCVCLNKCVEQGLVPGVNDFARRHLDPRCRVTCRKDSCACKPMCI